MIKSAILASVIPLLTAPIVLAGPYSDIPIGKPLDKRQTSSVRCTYAEWTFNSDGDTPCLVWAQVMNICSAGATVSPITTSTAPYRPPTGSSANECTCSVVSYNLMAGCSWCQPGILSSDWLSENQWKAGCSNYNDNGISVSTTGVNIPDWAFLPNDGDSWRSFAASAAAVAGPTGASNRTVTSTARPTSTRSSGGSGGGFSGSPSFDSGGTNIVAIAIGIVAGVYALIFLTVIITYCVRQKNRKAWYGPMAEYYRNGGQPAWAGAQPAGWTEAQGLLVSQDVPQPTGSPYPPSSTGHAPGGTNAYTPATSNVGLYQDVATSGTQYSQQPGGYPQQQTGGYPQPQAGGYPGTYGY